MNKITESIIAPRYLIAKKSLIKGIVVQDLGNYSDGYRGSKHPSLEFLYKKFPIKITREDLVLLYTEWDDPSVAFYATMVWGMIDVHKKNRFSLIQKIDSKKLSKIMESIKTNISKGQYLDAFLSCFKGGSNFIEGVGPSYFTKLFFFMGQADQYLNIKPLIMDKWTVNAYFSLKCETEGLDSISRSFSIPSLKSFLKYKTVPIRYESDIQAKTYLDYITKMNSWANRIGVPSEKLEQFVFGIDLRKDKTPSNPRLELLEIAKIHITNRTK
jgi:hypothetical protein